MKKSWILLGYITLVSSCVYQAESTMNGQEMYDLEDPCLYIDELDRMLIDALYFKNGAFQTRKIIVPLLQYGVINYESEIYQTANKDFDRVTNTLLEAGALTIFNTSSDYKYGSYGSMRFRNSDFQDCQNFMSAKKKLEELMY